MNRISKGSLLIALLLAAAGCQSNEPERSKGPSAIILITIDTLRADAVSFADEQPQTTPFLHSLAAQGIVYTHAYAPSSWTAPSMASMMTGLLPESHGVRRGVIGRMGKERKQQVIKQLPLSEAHVTLAERLKDAGFTTVGVPANLHLSARMGFAQGFDSYMVKAPFLDGALVNDQVRRLMQQAFGDNWASQWKKKPGFLWVHYFDPHMPYEARRPWVSRYAPDFDSQPDKYDTNLSAQDLAKRFARETPGSAPLVRPVYLSEVSYVDDQLRRLNETLHFDDPNVLVIVTSDHGEELNEHSRFGHGTTLFDEVVHVPLLVRWPARLGAAAKRIDQKVSIVDIYPTVVSLLGAEVPATLQGETLPLEQKTGEDSRVLLFETDRARPPLDGIQRGDWKLIRRRENRGSWRMPLLLNLRDDPGEHVDRSKKEAKLVADLEALMSEKVAALPPPPKTTGEVRVGKDDATDERLRALGYD